MALELSDSGAALPRPLARDEALTLRLAENPTTGFRWHVSQSGPGGLHLLDEQFVAGAGAPGAGGQRVLRFVGQRPGEVRLQAVLRRPWEPDAAAGAETRVYAVVVA
jgi:predicted secreted protein